MRHLAALAAAALLGGGLAVAAAAPAYAEEVYVRPADGVFHVDGHGWGHGRGLNQWGAEGAARQGVGAASILNAYYPGTTALSIASRPMRVLIQEDDGRDLRVRAAANLAVRDRASGLRYVLPAGYTTWRVTIDAAGQHVSGWNGAWRTFAPGGRSTWAGPLQFEGATPLRLALPDGSVRDYRGVLRAVRSGGGMATVNELSMEHYLYGVVPRESPASFRLEALKAQAVAARSYSAYKRDHVPSGSQWDICSTIQCQVYGGMRLVTASGAVVELESASTTRAVDETRGIVRAYGGKPIFAEYSSSNGGWSTASTTFPYLRAAADRWDALVSPHHRWSGQVTAAQIEARYPSVGRLRRIRVTGRDGNGEWGGRVKTVVLEGVDAAGNPTSVQSTGGGIYNANPWPKSSTGLRGSWWKIRSTAAVEDFAGTLVRVLPDIVVRPGHTALAWFDVKNTGRLSWPVGGAVRSGLRTVSPSYDAATWITSSRPGPLKVNVSDPAATSVRPGQVGRFSFRLAGNDRAEGRYTEQFSVVWETKYWMSLAVPLTYRVQRLFAAQPVSAPPVVIPGHGSAPAWFDVRNTGDMAWPLAAPIGSTAATSASADATWLGPTRPGRIGANVTRPGATEVAVGETARFPLRLAGNGRAPGSRTERFGIVWDGRGAAAVGVALPFTIRNVFTGTVTQPARVLVPRTSVALVKVDVRNTGNMTWPVRGAARISAPSTSPSRSTRWLSPTRPGDVSANLTRPGAAGVAPGEVARFAFYLAGNGRTVGTRATETFGIVFDGVARMSATVSVAYEVREALAARLTAVTSPLYLPRSGSYLAYVDVRNEGARSWPVGGHVRLTLPSTSPSRTSGWLAPTRPAAVTSNKSRPGATSVAPGEVARFAVPLSGNGRASGTTATEYAGMVWEGRYAFPLRVPLRYTVRNVFAGRVARVSTGVTVPADGVARVWVDVVNTGNLTWPVGGAVRAAPTSAASRASSWPAADRAGALTENRTVPGATVVRPRETARFAFDLAGNGRPPGTYQDVVRFVWETVAWLDVSATVAFTVA